MLRFFAKAVDAAVVVLLGWMISLVVAELMDIQREHDRRHGVPPDEWDVPDGFPVSGA